MWATTWEPWLLRSIIDYDTFKLLCVYEGICFKHVMCKTCQYVTNDDKVYTSLTLVSMTDVQTSLQKIIIWTKNQRKGDMSEKRVALKMRCDIES